MGERFEEVVVGGNFLPDHRPRVHRQGTARVVKCIHRNRDVAFGAEEVVRQRVLRWLLRDRGWSPLDVRLEDPIRYTDGARGRADIVLRRDGASVLVIECKAPEVMLGADCERQAVSYARKLRAGDVWLTNGDDHIFLSKSSRGVWKRVDACAPLRQSWRRRAEFRPPPTNATGRAAMAHLRQHGLEHLPPKLARFALAAHTLLFADPAFFKVPFSHRGVHVLEDRGLSALSIATPGSPGWTGVYRMFLVATEGRVETAGIAVNGWGDTGLTLCVAFLKAHRKHHALQLQVDRCQEAPTGWEVIHSGVMGGRALPTAMVLEAVREAGREDLLDDEVGVRLGHLPNGTALTWRSGREFLANLLHYSLIRSQFRDAHPYTHRRSAID